MWTQKPSGKSGGKGGLLWSYGPNQSPSRVEASCGVTAHRRAPALNILDTEQVSPLTGCLTLAECACVARRPSFAHRSANQPQRQQLRGAALRTWAEEAVTLSQRSANTELSVLNRDHRASTGSLSHCVMFKSVISQTMSADNLILC